MILAETVPTASQFGGFWAVVMFLSLICGQIATVMLVFKKERKENPQPFLIAMEKEFAKAEELRQHIEHNRREHENLFSKIGGVDRGSTARSDARFGELQKAAEDGREKLHDRINEVLQAVSELRGEVTANRGNQGRARP